MDGSLLARVLESLQRASWVWVVIWLGLAFLSIALVVLMRTKWGQSQPLTKCVGLSILAHLLLAIYATTIEIVSTHPGPGRGEGIHATFWDNGPVAWHNLEEPADGIETIPPEGSDHGSTGVNNAEPSPEKLIAPLQNDAAKQDTSAEPRGEEPIANATEPESTDDRQSPLLPAAEPEKALANDVQAAEAVKATAPTETTEPTAAPPASAEVKPTLQTSGAEPQPEGQVAQQSSPVAANSTPSVTKASGETINNTTTANTAEFNSLVDPTTTAPAVTQPASLASVSIATTAAASLTPNTNVASAGSASEIAASSANSTTTTATTAEGGPIRAAASAHVPAMYRDRLVGNRLALLRSRGGSPESEAAVQAALRWLAGAQSSDGRWDADRFGAGQERRVLGQERNGAGANADTAVTGLALLAFLGAGQTHLEGEYADCVRLGLEYLLSVQGRDGNLCGRAELYAAMYSHGMATLALGEALALSGDARLEPGLRKALNFTVQAQHLPTGSWRYQVNEPGDMSQLGWQLMALKSGEAAGITIPAATHDAMVKFLKSASSGAHGGLAAYRGGERPSRTMTAEALVCRQFVGLAPDHPAAEEAAEYLLGDLPKPDRINLYYWYYGTLGMYQQGGESWKSWNQSMQTTLVSRQVSRGPTAGSWDPDCVWGGYGGRVYSTALATLCLEVYYRYLPLYQADQRVAEEGRVRK